MKPKSIGRPRGLPVRRIELGPLRADDQHDDRSLAARHDRDLACRKHQMARSSRTRGRRRSHSHGRDFVAASSVRDHKARPVRPEMAAITRRPGWFFSKWSRSVGTEREGGSGRVVEHEEEGEEVDYAVAVDLDQDRRPDDPPALDGRLGLPAARRSSFLEGLVELVRAERIRPAETVDGGRVGPEHRPIPARDGQERGRAGEGHDDVAGAVAVEVGRGLDQRAGSFARRR